MIKEGHNIFYIGESAEKNLAEITFEEKDYIVINHTFVNHSLRGQGIALQLVNKVVEYAKNKNKKVIPICSYAKKVMQSREYDDIIYH
jgi:predicted GNAT family acetyltransferase